MDSLTNYIHYTPPTIRASPTNNNFKIPEASNVITPINGSKHLMVSAFIDHRLDGVIRVISIINRNSLQPLYCVYCSTEHDCRTVQADVQIHTDHFSFPYGASDVICKGKHMQNSTHVLILSQLTTVLNLSSTDKKDSVDPKMEYLPIRNKVARETFKFNFTICISNLFGDYNNVLQFAQTMEMYKLLGVQHVVIYKTKRGPDLEKLLKHYETEEILEIVSWPIDKFLHPSSGWNIETHKGDIHYYENHIFPKTQFEDSGKFKRAEWNNIPGVNIMEHIYREPDRKNIYNPTKMIVNPSKGHLTKDQLFVDKRVWDFEQELIPNVGQTLKLSGLLKKLLDHFSVTITGTALRAVQELRGSLSQEPILFFHLVHFSYLCTEDIRYTTTFP
ncbi:unnamed protein product [Leuciscus chuanchicus]